MTSLLFIWVALCFVVCIFLFYFKLRTINGKDRYTDAIDQIIRPDDIYTAINYGS